MAGTWHIAHGYMAHSEGGGVVGRVGLQHHGRTSRTCHPNGASRASRCPWHRTGIKMAVAPDLHQDDRDTDSQSKHPREGFPGACEEEGMSIPDFQGWAGSSSRERCCIWALRRARMELCIWLTRLSERSRVAPISFMVISSK